MTSPDPTPRETAERVAVHLATLYRPGLGRALLDTFGSLDGIRRQPDEALAAVPGLTARTLAALRRPDAVTTAARQLQRADAAGVEVVHDADERYPAALRAFADMPVALFVRGDLSLLRGSRGGGEPEWSDGDARPRVGVVGSRRPSAYGLQQARRFGAGLAKRGLTVVSGLAAGIDGEAHRAGLSAGGTTIAVLGSGLDRIYPPQHDDLAREMAREGRGLLVSEFPLGTSPRSFHFPLRNRIISALSLALVIVEAGERSGSLITARYALEQGATIYVVPGRVGPESIGGLRLLYDGATPALFPDDVLPEWRGSTIPEDAEDGGLPPARLDGPLGAALERLLREETALHPDAIADRLGKPPCDVVSELSRLELEGRLECLPGGQYALPGAGLELSPRRP